jgi:hypothetical protein
MDKRTPEQFLKEEGMTIETAQRIFGNIIDFINKNQHLGCRYCISYSEIIKECITSGTSHAGLTSAMQLLMDIDEDRWGFSEIENCDIEHCDSVCCCFRYDCKKYKKANEERAE